MIQCVDGMLMLKGSGMELLSDLSLIVFSMCMKQFDEEEIIAAVSAGIIRSKDEDAKKMMEVVVDKVVEKIHDEKPDLELNGEPISKDTFKKMFGEFFDD